MKWNLPHSHSLSLDILNHSDMRASRYDREQPPPTCHAFTWTTRALPVLILCLALSDTISRAFYSFTFVRTNNPAAIGDVIPDYEAVAWLRLNFPFGGAPSLFAMPKGACARCRGCLYSSADLALSRFGLAPLEGRPPQRPRSYSDKTTGVRRKWRLHSSGEELAEEIRSRCAFMRTVPLSLTTRRGVLGGPCRRHHLWWLRGGLHLSRLDLWTWNYCQGWSSLEYVGVL
jgi:hypothetical protein